MPASISCAARWMSRASCVQIDEPRPYGVSFARRIASSKSLKRNTGRTGPKTSSVTSRDSSPGSATAAGPREKPPPGAEPRRVARLGDDGGLEEEALVVVPGAAADEQLAAVRDAVLDLGEQLVAARACVDRPHPELRLLRLDGPVARLVAADALDELRDEGVEDGVVDEDALAAQARLARVPVAADDDRLDRGVDVGVGAHDHG